MPKPRVRDEVQRRAPACGETLRCGACQRGGGRPASSQRSGTRSCFTPQCEDGIKLYGTADCRSTSCKGDKYRDRQDDGEKHRLDRDLRIENRTPNLTGEKRSGGESSSAADHCQQKGLGKEKCGHGDVSSTESLHESNFLAALEYCCRHRRRNSQGRGE